MTFIDLVLKE